MKRTYRDFFKNISISSPCKQGLDTLKRLYFLFYCYKCCIFVLCSIVINNILLYKTTAKYNIMENNPIKRALSYKKLTLKWLAKKMNVNYAHLCVKIKENNLSLQEINSILTLLNLSSIIIIVDENNNVI